MSAARVYLVVDVAFAPNVLFSHSLFLMDASYVFKFLCLCLMFLCLMKHYGPGETLFPLTVYSCIARITIELLNLSLNLNIKHLYLHNEWDYL